MTHTDNSEQVLHFADGIPGFPDHRRFLLVDVVEGGAFQLMQSIDDEQMSMVVGVPWVFFPDYSPELPEADERELGITDPADAVVFCPVTLDPDDDVAYVNLLGPFVVNIKTLQGRQVVLADDTHPVRAEVRLDD
jgi:flagellar assembly factor FliW